MNRKAVASARTLRSRRAQEVCGEPMIQSRKTRFAELAIAGGTPAFSEPLHVGRPNIGDRERLLDRIDDLLDRRWLTNNGVYVQEFERRVCDLTGVDHCVATSSGTVALQILIRALGLTGEVILPSLTFVATAHALQWQGLTPVFCDVDPRTHTLAPSSVQARISSSTRGILGVHLWGQPCDVDALALIAERHQVPLIFDAAHAFGCSWGGQMVGGFGKAEVFSFHATKILNTFEGGAVVTRDRELAERLRLMRNFGFTGEDEVACLGTNGKMSEVCAAMGLTGLESLDHFIAVNKRHYERYRRGLNGLPGVRLFPIDDSERANYQHVVLEIDTIAAGLSRDGLIATLRAENVLARRYFYPGCHRFEPYRRLYPDSGRFLPVTEKLTDGILCLPTGTALGKEEIDTICGIVRLAITHAAKVRELVAGSTGKCT